MASIVQKGPNVYLNIANKWYVYDERVAPLGSGSMGVVYLGHSCDSGEPVAIKRVVDKYANVPSIRIRAKLEASLQFRHPHLIEMVGFCELFHDHGPLFILSHYISGQNIDIYIRNVFPKNTLNRAAKICQMFYPVLDALSYIHSKEIVHMDIKPSNIIVESGRNVRLMDLGIAQVGKSIDINGTSSLMGTPMYAAPEQFEVGQDSKLNPQTDIYEAGVTLYELLTGINPYKANTIQDSIRKHRTVILPYCEDVPKKLLDVLRRATHVDPSYRYRSAAEMKMAISEALIPAESSWWKMFLTVGGIIFLFLIVIMIVVYGQSN